MSKRQVLKTLKSYGFLNLCCLTVMGLSLSGCDLATNYLKQDRGSNMEMQDFRDGLAERIPEVDSDADGRGSSIPSLQPYISSVPENLKPMPLVSVSVNQSVPIRDVLFELAEQAEYDLELDPGIRGSVIFTARNKPFDLVIERISDIAGLRYQFKDEILRVEMDTPYNKTYKVDYLSYVRTNSGNVRNNIGVVSGEGTDTGSSFSATTESEANFWGEMETNLQQILGEAAASSLKTSRDPRIVATSQNPDVQPLVPPAGPGEEQEINVQPPEAVLNVESLPLEDEEDSTGDGEGNQASFGINKQAGIINVFASEKAHKEVNAYLRLVRRAVTAQVLIEAKILEVVLNDENIAGIDWRYLDALSGEGAIGFLSDGFGGAGGILETLNGSGVPPVVTPIGETVVANNSNFVLGFAGDDVQAFVQAVSGFGTVRALASPRLTVLNNQSAVLNVATNRVFFEIDVDVTTDSGVTSIDVDSDIRNVPEGVLVNVQPSINLDSGTISMAVRPTITNIVGQVADPAVAIATAAATPPITGIVSNVPEVNVQEIDSVIQVRSGQPIVMGGLLQDRSTSTTSGVPVLGEVPMLGSLFRKQGDLVQKTELVIFLKATIIESPDDTIHNTDRDLYRMFSGDRRPLKL
ncbi:MAG: type II and III secretion system protein [Micavibrio sp.]|nr:MAG: type II and III secretion system protein [Micavibrio sp.]